MSDAGTRRGQIDGVGVVLLTAIVVVAVGTFGVFYLGSIGGGAEPRAALDVRLTPVAGDVTVNVSHGGGTAFDADEVFVVLRDEGGNETRVTLSEGTLLRSELRPVTFEAGETWTYTWNSTASYADGDRLRVLVVHNATESVPFDSPVTIDEKRKGALAPKYEPPTAAAGGDGDGGAGGGDGGAGGGDGGAGGSGNSLPPSAVAFDDADDDLQYDDGETTYTSAELRTFDANVNLVVAGDASARQFAIDTTRITVKDGVSMSSTGGSLELTTSGDLSVDGAALESATSLPVVLDAGSGAVRLVDTTVDSGSSLRVSGGRITADRATLESATSLPVVLDAGSGSVSLARATVRSGAKLTVSAGAVTAERVTLESARSTPIELTATSRSIALGDATVDSGAALTITADRDVDVGGAVLRSPATSEKRVVLATGSGVFSVDGTEIVDQNDDADRLTFDGKNTNQIDGCPDTGEVSGYSCSRGGGAGNSPGNGKARGRPN